MKVCFVAFDAYPLFNPSAKTTFGGAEVQFFLLSNALTSDKNFDVHFLTFEQDGEKGVEKYNNITLYRQPGYTPLDSKNVFLNGLYKMLLLPYAFLNLFLILRRINADIYIFRIARFETGICLMVSRLLRKKTILTLASDIDVSGEYITRKKWSGILFAKGLKSANAVICQNQVQVELLKKNFDKKGIIIKTAYPLKDVEGQKKDIILWIARIEPWKQPEIFLELTKRFLTEQFFMIGPRSPAFPELFDQNKEKAATLPNLTFIDHVPFQEIDEYFKRARLFINTSKTEGFPIEGFPNTFVQTAKNKTPIVSWKVNPDGILDKYRMGFCAGGDLETMAKQVKLLLEDKNLWHEMAENGFRYAKENHSIEKVVEEYKELFQSLIAH